MNWLLVCVSFLASPFLVYGFVRCGSVAYFRSKREYEQKE